MKYFQSTSKDAEDDDLVSSVSVFFISSVGFVFDFDSPGMGNNIQESR